MTGGGGTDPRVPSPPGSPDPAGAASPVAPGRPPVAGSPRGRVLAWGLWDWASAAFNAVITTFVFTVYLTSDAFGPNATTWLSWTIGAAGAIVAIFAPVSGQRADRGGTRVRWLRINTTVVILVAAALFLVKPAESFLPLGLLLLGVGNIAFELASVNYNAMLADVATKENVGRVSGLGWGLGYVGGIVLLLIVFFGFVNPEVGLFGVTGEEGLDVRAAMLVCALWTAVFSAPLLLSARDDLSRRATRTKQSLPASYVEVFRSIRNLWNRDRRTVKFLISSAIFRDGLAGVFTFGGVIAAGTFGFSGGDVIIFGIVANLVAGVATIASGTLDDRLGPRIVILVSLCVMITSGLVIFFLHDRGVLIFWIFGLLLASCVGPVQSASRTFLARLIPPGLEGEVFGLYATTGRAVSFLAPWLFGLAILLGQRVIDGTPAEAQYWGILGIILVLALGLVLMIPVGRGPADKGAPRDADARAR